MSRCENPRPVDAGNKGACLKGSPACYLHSEDMEKGCRDRARLIEEEAKVFCSYHSHMMDLPKSVTDRLQPAHNHRDTSTLPPPRFVPKPQHDFKVQQRKGRERTSSGDISNKKMRLNLDGKDGPEGEIGMGKTGQFEPQVASGSGSGGGSSGAAGGGGAVGTSRTLNEKLIVKRKAHDVISYYEQWLPQVMNPLPVILPQTLTKRTKRKRKTSVQSGTIRRTRRTTELKRMKKVANR